MAEKKTSEEIRIRYAGQTIRPNGLKIVNDFKTRRELELITSGIVDSTRAIRKVTDPLIDLVNTIDRLFGES